MHCCLGVVFVNMLIHCLVQKDFHLFLKECVELCFELLFLLLGYKSLVVNLLVVLLDSKSKDGFLQLLSQGAIELGRVELNEELFSLLLSQFSLVVHVSGSRFNCSLASCAESTIIIFFFSLEHSLVLH